MIFETERLQVRKLILKDLESFHKMQSNPKVMQFATGEVKTYEDNKIEIKSLIQKYTLPNNDFWIYAVVRKKESKFVGTIALVKDGNDDEIGYRFLEEFWNLGYGLEICKGLLSYCKSIKMRNLVAYVVDKNIASKKILEKLNFKKVNHFMNEDELFSETKYKIEL